MTVNANIIIIFKNQNIKTAPLQSKVVLRKRKSDIPVITDERKTFPSNRTPMDLKVLIVQKTSLLNLLLVIVRIPQISILTKSNCFD